jgi:hypothetical protein
VCPGVLQGTVLSQFKDESKARMQVLQKLGHIDKDGTVLLKGRAACEIDTTDELLSTGVSGCDGLGAAIGSSRPGWQVESVCVGC